MFIELLVFLFLFWFLNYWTVFFPSFFSFMMFRLINQFIDMRIKSDDFVSNDMDADDNTSIYKCNNLNDCFKAFDESPLNYGPVINKTYKIVKKYISYPIEFVFSKSEILYVPQLFDKCNNYMLNKRRQFGTYLLNLDCSKRIIKEGVTLFTQQVFAMMMSSQPQVRTQVQVQVQPQKRTIDLDKLHDIGLPKFGSNTTEVLNNTNISSIPSLDEIDRLD